jgi:MoxR-like ATPase
MIDMKDSKEIAKFVKEEALNKRPDVLKLADLKWKYLVRSILRGKNIMMTGDSGCGKTFAAKEAANALGRELFSFNLGATQDPRSSLIGNTQFKEGEGTYFGESLFVKAIKTPNAVILLDELSRAHPEAWNILMTVLDEGQRYLRIDEDTDTPTIEVAEGVSFIATANIGSEYTSARVMDRATMDRFTIIEMDTLTQAQEEDLLKIFHPELEDNLAKAISDISSSTRANVKSNDPRITTSISTRVAIETAGLLVDGFTLKEAAEVTIYPFFPDEGGEDSERMYVRQLVQKYVDTDDEELDFGDGNSYSGPF